MTWSYPIDQIQTSPLAQLRYLLSDTDSTDVLVQDEEILYVLTVHPNVYYCAA